MSRDWERLGAAVKRAREARGITQVDLAAEVGVEESTIQNLESGRYGRGFTRVPSSAAAVAYYFQWPTGAVRALLEGGSPNLTPPASISESRPETVTARNVLPLRIAAELEDEGELIDATVLDLTPAGSKARMIVVVKGDPDASPEEIRRSVIAWRQTQRRLQELGEVTGSDDPPVANGA